MVSRLRLTLSLTSALGLLSGAACTKKNDEGATPPPPVDHLAPHEQVEGKDKAFALALPRDAVVVGRFADSVNIQSKLTLEDLANFVRARVKEGRVVAGGAATTFEDVVVPADPDRRLTIVIRRSNSGAPMRSDMIVRDSTPPPVEPGLSDEERFKKAGLGPDGKLLDPKHTE